MYNGARTHPSWNGRKVNAFVALGLAIDLISLSCGETPSYLTLRATDSPHWTFREWLSTTRLDRMAFLPPSPVGQTSHNLQLFESRVIDACVCSDCALYTVQFSIFSEILIIFLVRKCYNFILKTIEFDFGRWASQVSLYLYLNYWYLI